jgi:NADPH:quinone reductase-like Zn-dependent oxidoreductase
MSTSIPKTIKAIQIEKTGGPEVVVLNQIDLASPAANEVLVKVEWGGVNYGTLAMLYVFPRPQLIQAIGNSKLPLVIYS